jgi:RND family efflux transporter MFP subunit
MSVQNSLATSQFERFNQLAATNVLSASQLDGARAQRDVSKEDLASSQAQLGEVLYEIAECQIRAPFPGVVAERSIQKGEYAQVGSAVVRLVDIVHVEARAMATLELARNVHSGQHVSIRANGAEIPGTVRTIVPVGDDHSRQFEVRIAFAAQDWLVGSAVDVSLPATNARSALTVSRDALVIRHDGSYVMRVTNAGTVEQLDVTPGTAIDNVVEVTGRLVPGDRVVVRGAERLSTGQAVRVVNLTPPTAMSAQGVPR